MSLSHTHTPPCPEIMLACSLLPRITSAQDASLGLSRSFRKRPGKAAPLMDPQPKGALPGPGSGVEGVRLRLTLWPSVWGGVLLLLMVPVLRSAENGSAPSTASADQSRQQPFEVRGSLPAPCEGCPPPAQPWPLSHDDGPPLCRMWTSPCSRCRRAMGTLLSASLTTASRSPRSPLGRRLMTAETLRAGGSESSTPGTGTAPGSPAPASPRGGPPAGTKASPRWKGEGAWGRPRAGGWGRPAHPSRSGRATSCPFRRYCGHKAWVLARAVLQAGRVPCGSRLAEGPCAPQHLSERGLRPGAQARKRQYPVSAPLLCAGS